ncbi:hypothetical protein C6499_10080 [Candidatus Poribacteria bacterium]|nr:MAG: hypothetical protein C6499_10080 [Candidatus Poribacteria bacterium]
MRSTLNFFSFILIIKSRAQVDLILLLKVNVAGTTFLKGITVETQTHSFAAYLKKHFLRTGF